MSEFRARLRRPRDEYVLGAVVSSVEMKQSRANGRAYALLRFANHPMLGTFGVYSARMVQELMQQHGLEGDLIRVGDVVNLEVRWRPDPAGVVYPQVLIDPRSLVSGWLGHTEPQLVKS